MVNSKHIAFYLRSATGNHADLSRQRRILDREFARKKFGLSSHLIEVYCDDIQSGLRPGPEFMRLRRDIECGKIDVVLVSRFNRIGRTVDALSEFLNFVKFRQIRFITANENIDSNYWPSHVGIEA